MNKYKIIKEQLDKMIDEAIEAASVGGKEVCGLIVDNGYFLELIQVNNRNTKGGGFDFFPKEIRDIQKLIEKLGKEIVGTWHSHPFDTAKPGESDIENALENQIMLIISVQNKNAAMWQIKDKKANQLNFNILELKKGGGIQVYKKRSK